MARRAELMVRGVALPSALLAGSLALAGCAGSRRASPPAPGAAAAPARLTSNVQRADYAGSKACAPCHADLYASFVRSPMHNMTRAVEGADVKAPFDGSALRLKDDTARLETRDGRKFVRVESARFGSGLYRVTRVIGGHYREDFAGVRVDDYADPPGDRDEVVLPVSYVYATRSLRYKGYSVMVRERPGLHEGTTWSKTCVLCHNTGPYLTSLLGALGGKGVYQGEVVDPLLPADRRWSYAVTDARALEEALASELRLLGAEPRPRAGSALDYALAQTRARFKKEHLVEVGIGCESCHLGSAAHARDPAIAPSLVPTAPFLRVGPPGRAPTGAEVINRACARCHQVLFSGYEHTWEAGRRREHPGGSNINSGEARDLLLGDCYSQLACTRCHDPHEADGSARLARLDGREGDAVCTKCHAKYVSEEAQRAHAHHDPAREGARCMSCHMPRKTMTLDGRLGRYHRVGSPTDPVRVMGDRPLECALCHADKTVREVVDAMQAWWKKSYDSGALTKLYGSLDRNVVEATLSLGKPHEQAVALHVAGERGRSELAPAVAPHLAHAYPIVRPYAKRALEAFARQPCSIDLDGDAEAIARGAAPCLAKIAPAAR
jgi:predicted CXXCH cytochrome family protein